MATKPNPFKGNTPRTQLGLSGLGAAGGPQGLAAGGLRVLVEFITQYDRGQVQKLESDLQRLAALQARQQARLTPLLQQQQQLELRINEAQQRRASMGTAYRREITQLSSRYQSILNWEQKWNRTATQRRAALDADIQHLARTNSLTEDQVRDNVRLVQIKAEEAAIQARLAVAQQRMNGLVAGQLAREEELGKLQQFRSQLLPKLGALSLGAIGGVFGGALLGVGFQAGQDLIDSIGNSLHDLIDPARHARENLDDVAKSVQEIASAENLTQLEAAGRLIDNLGSGKALINKPDNELERTLALAAATEQLKTQIDELDKVKDQAANGDRLWAEQVDRLRDKLQQQNPILQEFEQRFQNLRMIDAGLSRSSYFSEEYLTPEELARFKSAQQSVELLVQSITASVDPSRRLADNASEIAAAFAAVNTSNIEAGLQRAASAAENAANAVRDIHIEGINNGLQTFLDNNQKRLDYQVTSIRNFAEQDIYKLQQRLDNLGDGESARTRSLKAQLDALSDAGPSRRTNELAAAIERLNAAEAARTYRMQLQDIRQERHLLLLEMELSTARRMINVYNYVGKARVVAINAEIARLGRVEEAQQRILDQMDRLYRANQILYRNQGESIQDFLARRSMENMKLLGEEATAERQAKINNLETLKDRTEQRIKIRENEEKRTEAIRKHNLERELAGLQERLKASQEADQAALEARRESLQEQLQASQDADQAALESKRKAIQLEMDAVRRQADHDIEEAQKAAEGRADAAKKAADKAIEQEKKLAEARAEVIKRNENDIAKYAQASEVARYRMAYQGAQNLEELNLVAGQVAGSSFAYGQLLSSIMGMGLPDSYTASILSNVRSLRAAYVGRMMDLGGAQINRAALGFAEGGVFELKNSMNFGNNIRTGEQGTELGIVLSNKVAQAVKSSGKGLDMGGVTINTYENPYKARYELRKTVRELVREELRP